MEIIHIFAMSKTGCIGDKGTLPWRCKADLQHFKETTMGEVVIMGRKTYESLPVKLKGRDVIVITRQNLNATILAKDGYVLVNSFEAALEYAKEWLHRDRVFVAGGGEIYRLTADRATKILMSVIDVEVMGDTMLDWKYPDGIEVVQLPFKPD